MQYLIQTIIFGQLYDVYVSRLICHYIQAVYNINSEQSMATKGKDKVELSHVLRQANKSLLDYLTESIEKYIALPQDEKEKNESIELQKKMDQISVFDQIDDFVLDESLESRIINLKLTQFSQRRKDDLFKKFKKGQEEKLIQRKKNIEKNLDNRYSNYRLTKGEFLLRNEDLQKTETFPITAEDMGKLQPDTDLNDTIVGNYIKLIQFVFFPKEIQQRSHIYSSFFLEKLVSDFLRQDFLSDKENSELQELIRQRVKQNYKNVKRWTKKIDIFEKEVLVFPVNGYRHWFCLFVIRPKTLLSSSPKCQIIYCDSMFENNQLISQAIRKYIQHELQQKKNIKLNITDQTMPCYQLLLPRQTNNHDCGLYMMTYIEELLTNPKELQHLSIPKNRRKLNIFPRSVILTMRQRLKILFMRLINARDQIQKNDILVEYKGERQRIMKEAEEGDYDFINQKQFRKYEKMNISSVQGATPQEKRLACEIKFYLDPQINFYQKDK